MTSTQSESVYESSESAQPVPGALLIFSGNTPQLRAVPVSAKTPVILGRNDVGGVPLPDQRVSSRHCEVRYDGHHFTVSDLNSNNGTWVDGVKLEATAGAPSKALPGSVLRLAQTVFLLCADLRPLLAGSVTVEGKVVVGPSYRAALDRIAAAGRTGISVLITGENGTGKEWAAKVFHDAVEKPGPFVPVNCAAITTTLADSLFFGVVKNTHSQATADAPGFVQAADGGVLFLDELGELDLQVQAKLLRVVQEKQVTSVGATTAKSVKVRICAATNRDLRAAIGAGTFRDDLFFRLAQCEVPIPSLAQRREEIPWLLAHALGDQPVHVSLVELALLRPWPGNVRDLITQAKQAGEAAKGEAVRAQHLAPTAGMPTGAGAAPRPRPTNETLPAGPGAPPVLGREEVVAALASNNGNIAGAARTLGLHRTQLYRLMKRHGLDAGLPPPADAE